MLNRNHSRAATLAMFLAATCAASDPSMAVVDHAAEMTLCRQKISEQVTEIIDWQWRPLTTFGNRRVRKGDIVFVDLQGRTKRDSFTCTFDEPPVGNDFFIGAG